MCCWIKNTCLKSERSLTRTKTLWVMLSWLEELLMTWCLTSDISVSLRRLHLHKKRSEVKQPFAQLAGVSLLKPLKGVDPNLISNLETFFTLDYPKVMLTTPDQRTRSQQPPDSLQPPPHCPALSLIDPSVSSSYRLTPSRLPTNWFQLSCDCLMWPFSFCTNSHINLLVLQYEILLCIQDQDDPAVDVCKKLLGKYPNVDARLFIGEQKSCVWFVSVLLHNVFVLPINPFRSPVMTNFTSWHIIYFLSHLTAAFFFIIRW